MSFTHVYCIHLQCCAHWSFIYYTLQVDVGPESVQFELTTKALCFGGDTCTATDIAVAAGIAEGA